MFVLIVAKCIVNRGGWDYHIPAKAVLIVAKCIVNIQICYKAGRPMPVLIVAKCIVNPLHSSVHLRLSQY